MAIGGRLAAAARSALARNAGKLAVGGVLTLLLGLAQSVVVARALGPHDFGVAALILAFPALVFTFFDPQASEAVVKYIGQFTATDDRRGALAVPKLAYGVDAVLAVLGFVVVAACGPWAADHLLDAGGHGDLLVLVAGAQMLSAPSDTSRAILTTFDRFSAVAWVLGITAVARFLLVLVLVGGGGGLAAFVVATCAGTVLEAALMGFLAHRAVRSALGESWWHGRRADVKESMGEMGRFLLYTDLTTLVSVFVKQADIVILGAVAGPVQVGYYRLARSLTGPITSVTLSLQAVIYPQVARLAATADGSEIMRRARRWWLLAGLPLAGLSLLLVPVTPELIRLVSGPAFVGATPSTRWLLVGSAFVLSCFWLRPIQLATGQVRFMFLNGIALGVVSVAAFVLLAGPFGAAGVAAARTVVAGFVGSGAGLLWLRSLHRAGRLVAHRPVAQPAPV